MLKIMVLCFCVYGILEKEILAHRILGVSVSPFYSHQSYFYPLWRNLSSRGHELTIITTHPMNDSSLTNVREIDLHYTINALDAFDFLIEMQTSITRIKKMLLVEDIVEMQLQNREVQSLINNKSEDFDLILVDMTFPIMFGFVEIFNCPAAIIFSLGSCPLCSQAIGNPHWEYTDLTLVNKVLNNAMSVFINVFEKLRMSIYMNTFLKKHFGNDCRDFETLTRDVSAVFQNGNDIFWPVQPKLPNFVQIGGFTLLEQQKNIPEKVQHILDNSVNGFIYVSLGTVIKTKNLSENHKKVLLQAFKDIPYTVLWKCDDDTLDVSENVITSKWLPQLTVLKHPNIKLFITQGGIHSVFESIHSNVPMIGIPVYFDQLYNCDKIVSFEVGLKVNFEELNAEKLKNTILEIIENPRYTKNVKKLNKLMFDQPETGMDRAVWWIEYILRHNGTRQLRTHLLDLPFYEYYSLDIYAVYVLVAIALYLVLKRIYILFMVLIKNIPKLKKE